MIYFRKLDQENDNAVLEKDVQDGDQTDFINDRTHDSIHLDVKLDAATADTTYDEKDNGNVNVERGANVGVDEADIISDEKFFQRSKRLLRRRSRIKKRLSLIRLHLHLMNLLIYKQRFYSLKLKVIKICKLLMTKTELHHPGTPIRKQCACTR